MYIVLGSMYETMSISTGLYSNLDSWNANKLNYITFYKLPGPLHSYNIGLGIYRKPTHTDISIQFPSNHPHKHKMLMLPITKQQEWEITLATAKNNEFPIQIIHNLHQKKQLNNKENPSQI